MPKLGGLKIIPLVFIILPLYAYGEWILYGERENGDKLYYHTNNKKLEGYYKIVWILADFKLPRNENTNSGAAQIKVDCKRQKYHYLNFIYFAGPMGTGEKNREVTSTKKNWIAPKKNTPYIVLFRELC